MKFLSEKFKTLEGASKRARFENGMAKGEFERGDKAKLYNYGVMQTSDGVYRVWRDNDSRLLLNRKADDQKTVAERKWQQGKLAPVAQKPCDHGLFSDDAKQLDLIDELKYHWGHIKP